VARSGRDSRRRRASPPPQPRWIREEGEGASVAGSGRARKMEEQRLEKEKWKMEEWIEDSTLGGGVP